MNATRRTLLLCLLLAGCSRPLDAVQAQVRFEGFRPGCVTFTATDANDASRSETRTFSADPGERSGERMFGVYKPRGWSSDLVLSASAHEQTCDGRVVTSAEERVSLGSRGEVLRVQLFLSAEDLDADGFVSAQGGSDCDDTSAEIKPGAIEACDEIDNNCDGRVDETRDNVFYLDADGDGYGSETDAQTTCAAPSGYVARAGDCDDTNAYIHPKQDNVETACDGVDDDCQGGRDDDFPIGIACQGESSGCTGQTVCAPPGSATAVVCGAPVPRTWYLDLDGDGVAGSTTVRQCAQPVNGATVQGDCNDGDPFTAPGRNEICDQTDNDCNPQTTEAAVCGNRAAWNSNEQGEETLMGVSLSRTGRGWMAGLNGSLWSHTDEVTNQAECARDVNWSAVWARPSDGQAFLGSSSGLALQHTGDEDGCINPAMLDASAIQGLVGFESGGTTRIYAATASGRIIRWIPRGATTVMHAVPSVLYDIHGKADSDLLAVGGADPVRAPRIYRFAGGIWREDNLQTLNLPAGSVLRGGWMVQPNLAFAVGTLGVALRWDGLAWTRLPEPPLVMGVLRVDFTSVVAFGAQSVYATDNAGRILRYTGGTDWVVLAAAGVPLRDLAALRPDQVWAVGDRGTVVSWPDSLPSR